MTENPIRYALCVGHALMPAQYIQAYANNTSPKVLPLDHALFDLATALVDRAECETNEHWKQLLPYIVVTNERGDIFSYYRGGQGNEARLHGSISIGLGGHVDVLPPYTGHAHLAAVLESEALRELHEEIGVMSNKSLDFEGVIIDPTNAVGRVHLGLLTRYQLTMAELFGVTLEHGMIEKGEFRTLLDLRRPEIYDRLENWSKAVVDYLLTHPH